MLNSAERDHQYNLAVGSHWNEATADQWKQFVISRLRENAQGRIGSKCPTYTLLVGTY